MSTSVDFPNAPVSGQTYTYSNSSWTWNGSTWELFGRTDSLGNPKVSRLAIDADTIYVDSSGDNMTFTDVTNGTKTLTELISGGGGGSSFWTSGGTYTRTSNTTFTASGDTTGIFAKGMIVRWSESAVTKVGMVAIPSTYSAPNTTVTIIGDTMTTIDANSFKYCLIGVETFLTRFNVIGNIGVNGTDVSNAFICTEPSRVIGVDLQVGSAGVTNNTTIDINKNGTTMFSTKPTITTSTTYSPTPFTADSGTSLALGDRVSIDIDAVQTTPATDLYIQLYLLPTRYLNLA